MKKRRIASSLAAGILSEATNKLFPFLTLHLAANRLGSKSFGVSQFSQSILDVAIFFVVFGYQNWALLKWRFQDNDHAKKELLGTVVGLRILHALVAMLAMHFVFLGDTWLAYRDVVLSMGFMIATSALDATWVLTALNRLPLLSSISIFVKIATFTGILFFVNGPQDAKLYTGLILGSNAAISIATLVASILFIGIRLPTLDSMREAFKSSLPFSISFALMIAVERFDLFLVDSQLGVEGIAHYAGPARLAQSLIPIAGMVSTVFLAEILSKRGDEKLTDYVAAGCRLAFLALVPLTVGIWFVHQGLLLWILGPDFKQHTDLAAILMATIPAHFILLTFGHQILSLAHRVADFNWAIISGIVAGFIYWNFVRTSLTVTDVAKINVCVRWVACLCVIYFSRNLVSLGPLFMAIGQTFVPTFPMVLLLWVLQGHLEWPMLILCGGVLYGIALFMGRRYFLPGSSNQSN
jgi:O-antigen/teichoic acid export membrane protein